MKKFLSMALALVLLLGLAAPLKAFAANAQSSGFEIANGILYHYTGNEKDVVTPSGVKIITNPAESADGAFEVNKNLVTAVVSEGVQTIGSASFAGCENLRRVTLPASLRIIGPSALSSCPSLAYVHIPNGVTSIEEGAFSGDTNLTAIVIPESVTSFGKNVFYLSTSGDHYAQLYSLTIYGVSGSAAEKYAKQYGLKFIPITREKANRPASYTRSGDFIMDGTVLAEYVGNGGQVTIPSGVTEIGDSAFSQDLTGWKLHGDTPDPALSQAVQDAHKITSIIIPNTVTRVGGHAFFSCYGLTELTVPDSVQDIGYEAFGRCGTNVYVITSVEDNGMLGREERYYPKFSKNTSTITLPKKAQYFGDDEFIDCWGLQGVVIPEGVAEISECMFYGCENMETITFPSTIKKIPDNLCNGMYSLKTIRGYAGTVAEAFAKKARLSFEKIG
ncbi:leucine-rich repeat domain-containing protein [Caproiciproducens sp. CPB-2]|uniref:leucine-rich repeat domain-containing protein n=1 Tax=Caproiciproducens sp. CPB-2 TaxID=3030017 RepID=UPI0023DA6F24|nr:leucine-rich repeat domain-containing protein [Caproiciproducens sp. CPB-2]MDF1494480.1 leucine-rich repeat domain-containing protein [Caproiciproducens sp. CPB-2]